MAREWLIFLFWNGTRDPMGCHGLMVGVSILLIWSCEHENCENFERHCCSTLAFKVNVTTSFSTLAIARLSFHVLMSIERLYSWQSVPFPNLYPR